MLPLEEEKDHLVIETPTCSQIIWDFYICGSTNVSVDNINIYWLTAILCVRKMEWKWCTVLYYMEMNNLATLKNIQQAKILMQINYLKTLLDLQVGPQHHDGPWALQLMTWNRSRHPEIKPFIMIYFTSFLFSLCFFSFQNLGFRESSLQTINKFFRKSLTCFIFHIWGFVENILILQNKQFLIDAM